MILTLLFTEQVLIETLWNVKVVGYDDWKDQLRFNRNIVECKVPTLKNAPASSWF